MDVLRSFIRESINSEFIDDAHYFVKKWYKDHRAVKNYELFKWERKFSYSGNAFRALTPDSGTKGTTSWSKSVEKLEQYTKEVEPFYNGETVVSAELVRALDLEQMCDFILRSGQSSEEVESVKVAGEVVNLNYPRHLSEYGIVASGGTIKKSSAEEF